MLGDQTQLSRYIDFSEPFEALNLFDKSVLITGGASGMGEAYVRGFADHGFGSAPSLFVFKEDRSANRI